MSILLTPMEITTIPIPSRYSASLILISVATLQLIHPAPCPAFSNRCPPCRIVSYSSSASLISLSHFSSSFATLPPLLPNLHRPLHNLLIPLHLPQNHLPYPLWSRSVSYPLQSLLVPRTSRNHTREYSRCCYGRHYHNAIFFPRGKVGHTSRSSWRKCGDYQEMGVGNRVM